MIFNWSKKDKLTGRDKLTPNQLISIGSSIYLKKLKINLSINLSLKLISFISLLSGGYHKLRDFQGDKLNQLIYQLINLEAHTIYSFFTFNEIS